MGLALECVGLLTLLNKTNFSNYSKIFKTCLVQTDEGSRRDKVIALKSSVDGLIVHGVFDDVTNELFEMVTNDFLKTNDRILRQVAIEGVCKLMFVPKLCDDNDPEKVEAIIAQLLFQLFDKKYNWQNSLVRSILTLFLKQFVMFSEKRCVLIMNALFKVVYSIFRQQHGVIDPKKVKAKPAKKVAPKKGKKKTYDESSEESDFSVKSYEFVSDDSEFAEKTATAKQICEALDCP